MPAEAGQDWTDEALCEARQVTGTCPYAREPEKDPRIAPWLDTLENGEHVHARRLLEMPLPMAVAMIGVQVQRLETKMGRSWWREGAKALTAAVAGGVALFASDKGLR